MHQLSIIMFTVEVRKREKTMWNWNLSVRIKNK